MSPKWANLEDVRNDALGADEDFSDGQIIRLIERAERLIIRTIPGIESHVKDGKLSADTVADVVSDMVTRVLRNPAGIRTIQDSTGPFSGSTTFAGDNPGSLHMTDVEVRALTVDSAAYGRRAYTIMPSYRRAI